MKSLIALLASTSAGKYPERKKNDKKPETRRALDVLISETIFS